MDREKSVAIREYLSSEFPDCSIEEDYDSGLDGQRYRIHYMGRMYTVIMKKELLDHYDASVLPVQLSRFTLLEHLRELPDTPIVVGRNGLSFEYD